MPTAAWLLNLDAELELAAPANYATKRRVTSQIQARRAACRLLTRDEPIVGEARLDRDRLVFCWCPTPTARRLLERLGARAVLGPELRVLRSANHRALGAAFGGELRRKFVTVDDDWRSLILGEPSPSGSWRLKRAFGFAGRGQRRVSAPLSADDLRWIEDSLRQGGVLREVELALEAEFSVHGYIDARTLLLGNPVRFSSDAFGAPSEFHLLRQDHPYAQQLRDAARVVAQRLLSVGYFGPFGVDAFSWLDGGRVRLNAVSDVNARFTLAWSLGMGDLRARALECYVRPSRPSSGVSKPEG